jgi:hypothetical protein
MLADLKNVIQGNRKVSDNPMDYQNLTKLLAELSGDTNILVDCASFYGDVFEDTPQKVTEFVETWFNPTPKSSESFNCRHRVYEIEENEKHIVDLKQTSSAGTIKGSLEYTCSRK